MFKEIRRTTFRHIATSTLIFGVDFFSGSPFHFQGKAITGPRQRNSKAALEGAFLVVSDAALNES